jgi:hypothetical protein
MLMRVSSFLLVLLVPLLPTAVVVHAVEENLVDAFLSWIDVHGKTYDSHGEHEKRMEIWMQNDGACVHNSSVDLCTCAS